jgi:hypothetical protein
MPLARYSAMEGALASGLLPPCHASGHDPKRHSTEIFADFEFGKRKKT